MVNFFLLAAIEAFEPRSTEEFANDCSEICLHISVVGDAVGRQLEENMESVSSVSHHEELW